jgi:hypothetical protein
MRIAALLALLSLALPAAARADEKGSTSRGKPKATLTLDGIAVSGDARLPARLVLTRSKEAKADVNSAGDHLEDATRRP